jgi:circadian clock protein KaiC
MLPDRQRLRADRCETSGGSRRSSCRKPRIKPLSSLRAARRRQDDLGGGLERRRLFLVEGSPGTGKTTVATQFLLRGAAAGERCLYITLSETEEELRAGAASHGWDLSGLSIFELTPPETLLDEDQQQSLLYSSDLELGETTRRIFDAVAEARPALVVLDSLSEIRLLAQGSLRYRRQILAAEALLRAGGHHGAHARRPDDRSERQDRPQHRPWRRSGSRRPDAGLRGRATAASRVKYRGRRVRGGYHDFAIQDRRRPGVSPARLGGAPGSTARETVSTGSGPLDALLGGGVERGSSVLVLGPAGTGKSLLTLSFVESAVARGEAAAVFVFDEERGLMFERARGLGIDLQAMIDAAG